MDQSSGFYYHHLVLLRGKECSVLFGSILPWFYLICITYLLLHMADLYCFIYNCLLELLLVVFGLLNYSESYYEN
jgi:hypothetical protein